MMQRQYRAEGRGFIKQIMKQKKKSFYKQFFSIYILLVLQNVITLSVNLTDNVMLVHIPLKLCTRSKSTDQYSGIN